MIRSLTHEEAAFEVRRNTHKVSKAATRRRTPRKARASSATRNSQVSLDGMERELNRCLGNPDRTLLANHAIGRSLHPTEVGWSLETGPREFDKEGNDDNALVFCLEGKAWLEAKSTHHDLSAGEAVVVPAGTPHRFGEAQGGRARIFWLYFRGEDSGYYVRALSEGLSVVPTDPRTREQVVSCLRQLSALMSGSATELQLVHTGHLLRLLLGELFCTNSRYALPESPPRHPSIDNALSYMQENVNAALNLADIARHAGLSVSYFCGLFGQQIGMSPMDYLIQLKLRRARRLLVTTALTIQEVAHKVGYEDAYYFSRLFRKLHGVPPVAYRREHALAA